MSPFWIQKYQTGDPKFHKMCNLIVLILRHQYLTKFEKLLKLISFFDIQAALAVRELAVRCFDYLRIIILSLVLPFATYSLDYSRFSLQTTSA